MIDLQYCISFRYKAKCYIYAYIYIYIICRLFSLKDKYDITYKGIFGKIQFCKV